MSGGDCLVWIDSLVHEGFGQRSDQTGLAGTAGGNAESDGSFFSIDLCWLDEQWEGCGIDLY